MDGERAEQPGGGFVRVAIVVVGLVLSAGAGIQALLADRVSGGAEDEAGVGAAAGGLFVALLLVLGTALAAGLPHMLLGFF